jgi:hypothetical protein
MAGTIGPVRAGGAVVVRGTGWLIMGMNRRQLFGHQDADDRADDRGGEKQAEDDDDHQAGPSSIFGNNAGTGSLAGLRRCVGGGAEKEASCGRCGQYLPNHLVLLLTNVLLNQVT